MKRSAGVCVQQSMTCTLQWTCRSHSLILLSESPLWMYHFWPMHLLSQTLRCASGFSSVLQSINEALPGRKWNGYVLLVCITTDMERCRGLMLNGYSRSRTKPWDVSEYYQWQALITVLYTHDMSNYCSFSYLGSLLSNHNLQVTKHTSLFSFLLLLISSSYVFLLLCIYTRTCECRHAHMFPVCKHTLPINRFWMWFVLYKAIQRLCCLCFTLWSKEFSFLMKTR